MSNETPTEADEIRFIKAYQETASECSSDEYGGMESARVYREWIKAGKPSDVKAFIIERANQLPFGMMENPELGGES